MGSMESPSLSWTLYCKCTNFQANHNHLPPQVAGEMVGLYIANVLTFKRITTYTGYILFEGELDSILQMY